MTKLKVMTVVGTRPEIIRLSRIICKLDEFCEHYLIHTGQNYDYELNEIFFKDLGLKKPKFILNTAGPTSASTIGNIIIGTDTILEKIKPDAVLVLGDTNSCLSIIAAKRKKIPIFHLEAGNRCFDLRVPEEINRKIVDHIADINLTYSTIAREYLLREGLPPDMVIKVGSPMREVLNHYEKKISKSTILKTLNLKNKNYFVASLHREENVDLLPNLQKINNIFEQLANKFKLPIILSAHPRLVKQINKHKIKFNSYVNIIKPLSFSDYIKLQMHANVVLSDSGTISEESSILNFPALNLRENHERPESIEEAAVMMVGLNFERVLQGIEILKTQPKNKNSFLNPVLDYSSCNVSEKIVRIIHSYTDYVNKNVWKKYD